MRGGVDNGYGPAHPPPGIDPRAGVGHAIRHGRSAGADQAEGDAVGEAGSQLFSPGQVAGPRCRAAPVPGDDDEPALTIVALFWPDNRVHTEEEPKLLDPVGGISPNPLDHPPTFRLRADKD